MNYVAIILAIVAGYILGSVLRPAKTKRVLVRESEAIARIRDSIEADIASSERRLLSSQCGWAEGDRLRTDISRQRHFLRMLPERTEEPHP